LPSSNPAFSPTTFGHFDDDASRYAAGTTTTTMTVQGTALKSFALLAILMTTASWSWNQAAQHTINPAVLWGSLIAGMIVAWVTIAKNRWAPVTAPLYAAIEGVFLGAFSNFITQMSPRYHDLPYQAVALTCGTLFCMLFIYVTGLIKVTPRLAAGIVAATGAIALVYLASMVLSLFHVAMPIIHDASPLGIGFSLFVVGLAAFNLLLDFDSIEQGQRAGAPKYMEWYGAFGLMVTLVWLYLEILRLLRKIQDRR